VARPKKDGTPSHPPRRRQLTELFVQRVKREAAAYNVWDTYQRGLVLRVQPSGKRAWKAVYRHHGRPRWYHLGDARSIGLSDARKLAGRIAFQVAEGRDPQVERRAQRMAGTFQELAKRYVEDYAKRKNKSWQQADALVRRYLVPKWGNLQASAISRADVRAAVGKIAAPILANQVLAAASAIFAWAVRQEVCASNPVRGIERNDTRSRDRVLSDSEVPQLWDAFGNIGPVRGAALKTILLTGQRPGEVSQMRREHIEDGWWEMPGEPVAKSRWPGTKNGQTHRVYLSAPVRAIIDEQSDSATTTGFVFAGPRGGPIDSLDGAMRAICAELQIDNKITPHDLRRTFSTKVTRLGFGRDAMNRVTNHREGGIADVYDRHQYELENQKIMEAVADHIIMLAERTQQSNVVPFMQQV
jgi:integrase